jgi:anti-sigma B factor antagonist
MQLDVRQHNEVSVVAVAGELDAARAPELENAVAKLLSGGRSQLVIDLSGTKFVDSSGLATLVRLLKRTRSGGGALGLCGLQPPVRKVFDLTRLDKAFDVYGDASEAVRRLSH